MSRRTLFLFVHIAYNLALGRRLASSRPLIVCALHWWNDARTRHFAADFPQAKFIHTVRDPIASFDRFFDWLFDPDLFQPLDPLRKRPTVPRLTHPERYISDIAAWRVFRGHIVGDRPYSGMERRTRAIRFEDLHSDTEQTMRDLADWLGIAYQASLLASTFNGKPYVVTRDGKTWSGPRPEKAQRSTRNVSLKDRALLYALFYENFLTWNYPCPKIFGNAIVRFPVLFVLVLLPMRMEIIVARAVVKRRLLPSLRHADLAILLNSLLRMVGSRLAIMAFAIREAYRRMVYRTELLPVHLRNGGMARKPRVGAETADRACI